MRKQAEFIAEGDMVDLEGDKYADPKRDKPGLECEYQVVDYVKRETPGCVAIGFAGFDVVGFPVGHRLKVHKLGAERPAVEGGTVTALEKRLALSLACYVSPDDANVDRAEFLRNVVARIEHDLLTGEQ